VLDLPARTIALQTESIPIETALTPHDVPGLLYYAQSGDAVAGIAARFGVDPVEVHSEVPLPASGLVPPGTLLILPDRITDPMTPDHQLIPDSEMVFSGTAVDFDFEDYIESAGGRLSKHREYLGSTGWNSGADEIRACLRIRSTALLLARLNMRAVGSEAMQSTRCTVTIGWATSTCTTRLFGQMLWT
jgi:hypothetical protein